MKSQTSHQVLKWGALIPFFAYVFFAASAPHSMAQKQQDNRHLQRDSPIVASQTSKRRIALVIGNGAYTNVPPLKNPPNDARDMAAILTALGFDVSSGVNVNQREMKRLIREFGEKLKGGGSGLFYFAGHGVQTKGKNYLIPTEADIQSEIEVEDVGVDMNLVLGYMDDAQNGLNIVILDACRNNPFARTFRSASNGLAQVDAPTGTLIAYATAPGRVALDGTGQNGLYTSELLKQMQVPGVSVTDMFMRVRAEVMKQTRNSQVPWESSSLVGSFYFAGAPDALKNIAMSKPIVISEAAKETAFWEAVRDSTHAQDFRDYLAKYPGGAYSSAARIKLRQLESTKSTSRPLSSVDRPSAHISGRFLNTKNRASYLELKSDGNFFSSQVFAGRTFQSAGKYEIIDKQITMRLEMGQAARGVLENDQIIFEDGSIYTRGLSSEILPSAPATPEVTISMVIFSKSPNERVVPSRLTIGGSGWDGGSDLKVIVNGQDISKHIEAQVTYNIRLKGALSELNVHDGKNEVIVIVNGVSSERYQFKQALK